MNDLTKQDKTNPPEHEQPNTTHDFPVVGLGASAGGLKALQQFFEQMPAENGMAFVVIMHLSPQHESHAADILQNSTRMPVVQVNERIKVEPNRVYVIPPTKHLAMADGFIRLTDPDRELGRHIAIDLFFRTLAETHRTHSACVVLSGTGADGSVGLKRLKEAGGIAIAQDPQDAEYDSMPRNAINTGMVDFVLPVTEIPEKLIEIWRNASRIKLPAIADTPLIDESQAAENALRDVLGLLRSRTGHDFLHYKRATILRRIERRMQVNTVANLPAYRDYLRTHEAETKSLLKDLLIGVTNFFRDHRAFEALEREVIPTIFEGKQANEIVRVWSAGCATGEEAYSVAMLLLEQAATLPQAPKIQIFATDIDEEAIATAREGSYPAAIEADVAPMRLRKFFTKEASGYRVNKEVRECILFAEHNLIKDPPFSKLDLVTCRNLLIYLNREVQEQVFELFHFALQANGFLFLGSSESADGTTELFTTVDKKTRIYRSSPVTHTRPLLPSMPLEPITAGKVRNRAREWRERQHITFGELHQRLVEEYAPPSVVINADYEVVHLSENVGRFLQLTGGEASLNLLKIVLPELRLELRTALFQALQTGRSTEARRVQLTRNGQAGFVKMIVRPVPSKELGSSFILVLFDEVEETLGVESQAPPDEPKPIVQQLETEVHHLKEQLQGTVEQYETSVEELKASNEELQAINEELRSTTEELETSKEELQSVNEELRTVNQELKNKVDEVSSVNDDLKNLMASTDIATIFLDRGLSVKRYTPRALDIFNLIPTDEGRQLADITHKLEYTDLLADANEVLDTLHKCEKEVRSRDGQIYLVHLLPYRTANERIDGVVLNFVDITPLKQVEAALQKSHEQLEARVEERTRELNESNQALAQQATALREHNDLLNLVHDAIIIRDANNRIIFWNQAAERLYGWTAQEAMGQNLHEMLQTTFPKPLEEIDGILQRDKFWAGELSHLRRDGTRIVVASRWALQDDATGQSKIVQVNLNITERKEAEEARERLVRQLVQTQEEERRRIARELHDHLGQQLTVLRLGLEALSGQETEPLDALRDIIKELDADIDFLVWELRPMALDDFGLVSALTNFVERWSKHFDLAVEFHVQGLADIRLSPAIETNLYRITQETLNNVAKHAEAKKVSVILERRDGQVVLIIEDDGIGFDPQQEQGKQNQPGLGLINMRERAILLDGLLEIESSPGEGTTIFVRIPLVSP